MYQGARHSGYLSNPPAQIQECVAHARTDQQQAGFQNSGSDQHGILYPQYQYKEISSAVLFIGQTDEGER